MNYFLYGPDTYRSRRKLHEIADAYRAQWGGSADFHWIVAGEDGVDVLEEAGKAASLFSQKKMIVAERVFSWGEAPERLIAFLKKHKGSRDTIIVVWEEEVGERQKKLCAQVKECADKSQEFGLFLGPRLARWIREEAGRRGAQLTVEDMAQCASLGPDLWAVAGEIEKIALGGGTMRVPSTRDAHASSAFDLGDAFFSSPRQAVRHLMSLIEQGQDELPLFAYLVNHARTLLILKICAEERVPVPLALAVHPYVIKKTARLVAGLNRDLLVKTLRRFFEEDAAIKTGDIRPYESILRMLL